MKNIFVAPAKSNTLEGWCCWWFNLHLHYTRRQHTDAFAFPFHQTYLGTVLLPFIRSRWLFMLLEGFCTVFCWNLCWCWCNTILTPGTAYHLAVNICLVVILKSAIKSDHLILCCLVRRVGRRYLQHNERLCIALCLWHIDLNGYFKLKDLFLVG